MERGRKFFKYILDFYTHQTNSGFPLAMKRHIRFNTSRAVEAFPSLFYDKVFTKSYQPFSIRYSEVMCLGLLGAFIFKLKLASRKQPLN